MFNPIQAPGTGMKQGFTPINFMSDIDSSDNYFSNKIATQNSGGSGGSDSPGFFTSLATMATGPVGGAIAGGLGLIGKGLSGWINYRDKKRKEKEAKKRYEEQIAEDARRWSANYALRTRAANLNEASFEHSLEQAKQAQENYVNDSNDQRSNVSYGKFMGLLNKPESQNALQRIYGGA